MSSTYSSVVEKRLPKSSAIKSPMLKSPLPKSPMPKSPVPKSPVLYEKYKSRCAYGLISFFSFRRSHSKTLISDKERLKRDAAGNGYASKRVDLLSNVDEKYQSIDDRRDHKTVTANYGGTKVKKIVGEDKKQIKKIAADKVECVKFDSEQLSDQSRNHGKEPKTPWRPRRLPIYGCYDVTTVENTKPTQQDLVDRTSLKSDTAVTPENGRHSNNETINCEGYDQHHEIDLQLRMNEAAEAFINQKLIGGKHLKGNGANHQSKHFMESLEILNSNKDLFIKLLHDPNSLLTKHIEDLRYCQPKEQQTPTLNQDKLSEYQVSDARECKESVCGQSLKSKSTDDIQPPEKIVVLRSGLTSLQNSKERTSHNSPQVQYRLRNVKQSVRPAFYPLVRIKRKLMHTMGVSRKQQQLMLIDGAVHKSTFDFEGLDSQNCGKGTDTKIVERSSLDKTSFACGGMTISPMYAKRKDQTGNAKKSESVVREGAVSAGENGHENSKFSISRYPKKNEYDINVESRVHLSELLNNGNEKFLSKLRPNACDGMSYVPEYGFLPMVSPQRKIEEGFVGPQMRFPPYISHQTVSKNMPTNPREKKNSLSLPGQNVEAPLQAGTGKPSDLSQMLEKKPNMSAKLFPGVKMHESVSSHGNDLSPRDSTKYEERKDNKISEDIGPSKPDTSCCSGTNQCTCTDNASTENGSLDFLRLHDLPEENQTSPSAKGYYSPIPFSIHWIKEIAEQPSPVSVLEHFFMEDIVSPLSAASKPAEPSVCPLQTGFEENELAGLLQFPLDLKINSSTAKEHGSIFKYVSTLLQASNFNLDEIISKCCLSDQIDNSCNHKLFCDYFIEVLLEAYLCYSSGSPWLSFIKRKNNLAMRAENMIHELMKYVHQHILLQAPLQNVEQIVKNDLTKSGMWMDIRLHTEDIVSVMVENILEELIIGTALQRST